MNTIQQYIRNNRSSDPLENLPEKYGTQLCVRNHIKLDSKFNFLYIEKLDPPGMKAYSKPAIFGMEISIMERR
jgi:hypothetical protein